MDTILVVDDTPGNLDILSAMLKDQYKVKVATNGKKALQIAGATTPPDLILLDIMMPEMDGFEVCSRLKQNSGTVNIPVIFITALGDIDSETMGLELGAVDYITKPFNPSVVEARIKSHLEIVHQRKSIERLLSKTLVGSIKILTDLLNALNKHASLITSRIRPEVMRIVKNTQRGDVWRFEIAASLSHIGCMLIDPTILRKYSLGLLLSEKDKKEYKQYLKFGADLLRNIPRLEEICLMLKGQTVILTEKELNTPIDQLSDVLLGAQLLRTTSKYQYYELMLSSRSKVLDRLEKENHHPQIIDLIKTKSVSPRVIEERPVVNELLEVEVTITADKLKEGMVLGNDCVTSWGMVIVPAGTEIGGSQLKMIQNFCAHEKMENAFISLD